MQTTGNLHKIWQYTAAFAVCLVAEGIFGSWKWLFFIIIMAIILLQDSDGIPRRGKTTASYLSYVPHDFYPYSSLYQTPWASCAICQTIPSSRCALCQIPPSTSVLVRLNHISIILIAPILSFAMQRCDFFPPSLIFNTFSVFLFIFKQITGCPMLDTPAISCSLGGTWQQTFPCSTTAEKNAYFHGPHSKQQDVHVMHWHARVLQSARCSF